MAGIDVFEPLTEDYWPAPTGDRDRFGAAVTGLFDPDRAGARLAQQLDGA